MFGVQREMDKLQDSDESVSRGISRRCPSRHTLHSIDDDTTFRLTHNSESLSFTVRTIQK